MRIIGLTGGIGCGKSTASDYLNKLGVPTTFAEDVVGEDAQAKVAALEEGNFDKFLALVKESGFSSFMYLQNVFADPSQQQLSLALAIAE